MLLGVSAQLAFVKRLDAVEQVRTDEGVNPFFTDEAEQLTSIQPDQPDDKASTEQAEVTADQVADTGI